MKTRLFPIGVLAIFIASNFWFTPSLAADGNSLPQFPAQLQNFLEAYTRIKVQFVEQIDDKKIFEACMQGMVSGIDPDSLYLDAKAMQELRTSGGTVGVGLELAMEDGIPKVVATMEGSPSYHSGILSGDLIIKIDDKITYGMTLAEASRRIRGKPNTQVIVLIARDGEPRPIQVTLKREAFVVQSARSQLLEPGYIYLRVAEFMDGTVSILVQELRKLYASGHIKGLVLDLRNNPGGLLPEGIGLASAFLPPMTPIMSTESHDPDAKRSYLATVKDYSVVWKDYLKDLPGDLKNVPLVVLVNGGTAAGSEIVASALQDHKRATIIGTKTFGRGSIQTIIPLSEYRAIKLTTARWYTSKGQSIEAKGVIPDIIAPEAQGSSLRIGAQNDPLIGRALLVLKTQLGR